MKDPTLRPLSPLRLLRPVLPALTALAALALALGGCGGATSGAAGTAGRVLTVGAPSAASPLAPGFVGVSVELYSLEDQAGTNPAALNPVFLALVRQLAPGQRPVLRLGGDSADKSWAPAAGGAAPAWVSFTFTPAWLAVARAVATDLRARVIAGINLEAGSASLAGAEARTLLAGLGPGSLAALELGNEPELYSSFNWYRTAAGVGIRGRPADWDPARYAAQVPAFAAQLPRVALAGPAVGSPRWTAALPTILAREHGLSLVTVHAYPLKHCSARSHPTIAQLLSPAAATGLAASLRPAVATAHRHGLPLRVDELNSVSCGGEPGVSDTFASALWSLDTLFALAADGVQGVNLHTSLRVPNHLFTFAQSAGRWSGTVYPVYYGALMFARAAPAGSRLLAVRGSGSARQPVWALRTPSGAIHVVAIDERASTAETLTLRLPGARSAATVERLTAPSLAASSGVTIDGQSFDAPTRTGELAGTARAATVLPRHGTYRLTVPAHSAALLEVGG